MQCDVSSGALVYYLWTTDECNKINDKNDATG